MRQRNSRKKLRILALIPARSGSKGIPNKNIVRLQGFPLLAYSVVAARLSKYIDRTIVTTDDEQIARVARTFGAETPFLRPKKISGDKSLDIEFFRHTLDWLKKYEGYVPDLIVHLRPTTPLREAKVIDRAIETILKDKKATALRSGEVFDKELPYKLFRKRGNYCKFFGAEDFLKGKEYYNHPRQEFPAIYRPNGYVDIVRPEVLRRTGRLHGANIRAFITEKVADIDRRDDLVVAQRLHACRRYQALMAALRKVKR